ncbi:hypothetical protein ADIS_4398 [Lunatimonas lonarensis]|uniref:Uncharacterized protein n=1 Tax=Lunatimonas lonarensis TaxID=1232681 RepID=R7ZMC1_9BACT|nr:hypothetical protein ADIS_4398 [Lunatimonas lonarensis]
MASVFQSLNLEKNFRKNNFWTKEIQGTPMPISVHPTS